MKILHFHFAFYVDHSLPIPLHVKNYNLTLFWKFDSILCKIGIWNRERPSQACNVIRLCGSNYNHGFAKLFQIWLKSSEKSILPPFYWQHPPLFIVSSLYSDYSSLLSQVCQYSPWSVSALTSSIQSPDTSCALQNKLSKQQSNNLFPNWCIYYDIYNA